MQARLGDMMVGLIAVLGYFLLCGIAWGLQRIG